MKENQIESGTSAYIFDYGGTLDTGGNHWGKVLWHAWKQIGVPVDENTFREAYVYSERQLAATSLIGPDDDFRQLLAVKLQLELAQVGCEGYHRRVWDLVYEQTCAQMAHSRDVLQYLATCYPLGIVSNFYGNMRTVLKEFGMDRLFHAVIDSTEVGVRKPDPRIFLLGVEALGCVPATVTVVGDSMEKDILPARKAGCRTVWLHGEQWDETAVVDGKADQIIDDLADLIYERKEHDDEKIHSECC